MQQGCDTEQHRQGCVQTESRDSFIAPWEGVSQGHVRILALCAVAGGRGEGHSLPAQAEVAQRRGVRVTQVVIQTHVGRKHRAEDGEGYGKSRAGQ